MQFSLVSLVSEVEASWIQGERERSVKDESPGGVGEDVLEGFWQRKRVRIDLAAVGSVADRMSIVLC